MKQKNSKERIQKKQKECLTIARQRALQFRRGGGGSVQTALLFVWLLLLYVLQGLRRDPRVRLRCPADAVNCGDAIAVQGNASAPERPLRLINAPYDSANRYRLPPSLNRLMYDLRRSAARKDAAAELELRIPDERTRWWVQEMIADGDINRLSVFVRPGCEERAILKAWREEADAHFDIPKRPLADNQRQETYLAPGLRR